MTGSTGVMSRRTLLRDLGHGAFALAVVGLAGCTGKAPSTSPPSTFDPLNYMGNLDEIESVWCEKDLPSEPQIQVTQPWGRVGDARASGYVLVRGGEATIIDTGPWCTVEVIEAALSAVGLDWAAVGSVIITHKHPDHWVGLSTAFALGQEAAIFAGAPDIPHIGSPRPVKPVGAGDRVMDLAIIPTPGHTPGHIAVHDAAAGVLVVGDAVYASDAGVLDMLPSSEDLTRARASLGSLVDLSFDTLLPGHGFPIIGGAWEALSGYIAEGGN
jgi:glyoxylase-like metal-dependent hydrolase (beta-lactamase superfamily II)